MTAPITTFMAASHIEDAAILISRARELLESARRCPEVAAKIDARPETDALDDLALWLLRLAEKIEADDAAENAAEDAESTACDAAWDAAHPIAMGA